MRNLSRGERRARTSLLIGLAALFMLACNLTTSPPTPTARPELPTATRQGAPTLFPSITPLAGSGSGGGVATIPAPANCAFPSGWVQYVVEPGDSISGLAEATGTTVQLLMSANCLTDPDTLFTGQVLYVPQSPNSG